MMQIIITVLSTDVSVLFSYFCCSLIPVSKIRGIEKNANHSLSVQMAKVQSNEFFFNWDSLHARLNSYYKAWSYKKKKHKKIMAYKKSL